MILDVADAEQVAALNDLLPERLDAVVNNAGVVVAGPIEAVRPDQLHRQLDVNVIGQLAVTQALLPRLRRSQGRVVFISSLNGRISMPMRGAYCAAKFALEAGADALRMELAAWHIPVIVVQPAGTTTDMWRTAEAMVEQTEAAMTSEHRDLYAKHIVGMKKFFPRFRRFVVPADRVAAVVEEALTARKARARYVVGFGPRLRRWRHEPADRGARPAGAATVQPAVTFAVLNAHPPASVAAMVATWMRRPLARSSAAGRPE